MSPKHGPQQPGLGAQSLIGPEPSLQPATRDPARRHRRAVERDQALERPTPRRAEEATAAHEQDAGHDRCTAVLMKVGRAPVAIEEGRIRAGDPQLFAQSPEVRSSARRRLVPEDGALVLHVVVQRAIHVLGSPDRERDQRQPMVVKEDGPWLGGKGSAKSSNSRRKSAAPPEIELASMSEVRSVQFGGRRLQ